eukprot:379920-Prymnesium_polylepis.1
MRGGSCSCSVVHPTVSVVSSHMSTPRCRNGGRLSTMSTRTTQDGTTTTFIISSFGITNVRNCRMDSVNSGGRSFSASPNAPSVISPKKIEIGIDIICASHSWPYRCGTVTSSPASVVVSRAAAASSRAKNISSFRMSFGVVEVKPLANGTSSTSEKKTSAVCEVAPDKLVMSRKCFLVSFASAAPAYLLATERARLLHKPITM